MTDVTNASRTMLMNIHTQQWDPELCKYVEPLSPTPSLSLSLSLSFLSPSISPLSRAIQHLQLKHSQYTRTCIINNYYIYFFP